MTQATRTIRRTEAPAIDAFHTTGTSPTQSPSGWCSREYNTVHLLGPGAVGREFLKQIAEHRLKLVAATDSSGSWHNPAGIDPLAVVEWKKGRHLIEHPLATTASAHEVLERCNADIVVDASSTDLHRPGWTDALHAALDRGACIASAAKASLCEAGAEWLCGDHAARVGINAVLGGTGRSFTTELSELQQRTTALAVIGNASTTSILEVVERGGSLEDGIAEAQHLGYLEPDPELDLRGTDAAVKLAIVAGIITGRRIDPLSISCEDIRSVDLTLVRERAGRDATTRLVGRLLEGGELRIAYEEIPRTSIHAVPCGRVLYDYRLSGGERRLHIGAGIGAAATAEALLTDVLVLARTARVSKEASR